MSDLIDFLKKSICATIPKPSNALNISNIQQKSKSLQIKQKSILNHQMNTDIDLNSKLKLKNVNSNLKQKPTYNIQLNTSLSLNNNSIKKYDIKSSNQTQSPPTARDKYLRDLRNIFNCDDIYAECDALNPCTRGKKCVDNICIDDLTHCINTGCGDNEICDKDTGVCEPLIQSCITNKDCNDGKSCIDNVCQNTAGSCNRDSHCIDYVEEGIAKNKCDIESHKCVQCLPFQPSICGNTAFQGTDPNKKYCDPVGNPTNPDYNKNTCFEGCEVIINGTGECCTGYRVFNDVVGDYYKEQCCKSIHDLNDWKNKQWNNPYNPSQRTKCQIIPEDVNPRSCNIAWGGREGGNHQCETNYCYPDGKCKPP